MVVVDAVALVAFVAVVDVVAFAGDLVVLVHAVGDPVAGLAV